MTREELVLALESIALLASLALPGIDEADDVIAAIENLRQRVRRDPPCACGELLDALIWCSGSQDFGPGGVARKGWLKKCKPLLDRLLPAEEEP